MRGAVPRGGLALARKRYAAQRPCGRRWRAHLSAGCAQVGQDSVACAAPNLFVAGHKSGLGGLLYGVVPAGEGVPN